MSNARLQQFYYTKHKQAVQIDCNFVVDSANSNGLGIRSLKGGGVQAVYMHTSSTPSAGNPNPAAGVILVQFQDSYNRYFGGYSGQISPVTGSAISSGLSVGVPYVIVSLSSTTLAQWHTAGLPVGITPAIGVPFVAAATSVAGGGTVKAVGSSGVDHIEVIGNPNLTLQSSALNIAGVSSGSYMLLQCLGASFTSGSFTPAGTNSAPALTMNSYAPAGTNDGGSPPLFTGTPAVLTGSVAAPVFTGSAGSVSGTVSFSRAAPTDESIIGLTFVFSNSSIMVQGE